MTCTEPDVERISILDIQEHETLNSLTVATSYNNTVVSSSRQQVDWEGALRNMFLPN